MQSITDQLKQFEAEIQEAVKKIEDKKETPSEDHELIIEVLNKWMDSENDLDEDQMEVSVQFVLSQNKYF